VCVFVATACPTFLMSAISDTTLMVLTVLTALLFPFSFALLYFSNKSQRASRMFICVVLSVATTIAANVSQIGLVVSARPHVVQEKD
jgi:type III secretory pathway component EscU